jgi:hypothetical protein
MQQNIDQPITSYCLPPSVVIVTHTHLYVDLAFFLSVVFFLENVFQQVVAHFYLQNDGLEIS